jgi:molybdopterin synthase catalytic subunit
MTGLERAAAAPPLGPATAAIRRLDVVPQPPADSNAADWIELTTDVLPTSALVEWAAVPSCGAVVTFLGTVRDHAGGRAGVESITYEAYEARARAALAEVVTATRARWPALGRVAVLHRVGTLALTDASVAVVVSAPHRAEAFDAARHCIDTLKETVPIWKQEHSADGSAWVEGTPIRSVRATAPAGTSAE